jgi:hypothetical protein
MDKLVKRVTVVHGSGDDREAKVVYNGDGNVENDEETGEPHFHGLERKVRNMLKAQMIAAQAAYENHLESAKKEGNSWLYDSPGNFMKARRKAMKEMRKSNDESKKIGEED